MGAHAYSGLAASPDMQGLLRRPSPSRVPAAPRDGLRLAPELAHDAGGGLVDVERLDVDKGPLRVNGLDERELLVGRSYAEVPSPRPGRVDLARQIWKLRLHKLHQLLGPRPENGSLLARLDDEADARARGGGRRL